VVTQLGWQPSVVADFDVGQAAQQLSDDGKSETTTGAFGGILIYAVTNVIAAVASPADYRPGNVGC
jgi:hypothetical protein